MLASKKAARPATWIILALVILAGLLLSFYFYQQTQNRNKNIAPLELPQVSVPMIPVTGETQNQLPEVQVGLYNTLELVFTASVSPPNPFETYLLKLEVTDPSGKKFLVDGFYDGDGKGGQSGRVWKARLTPYMAGTWTWRTVRGDMGDSHLENREGQFECVQAGNTGGVVSEGKHFRFQNGEYVYLVGNFLDFAHNLRTTHVFMSETTNDSQRSAVFARQRDFHNVNKANVYFANKGDYNSQSVTPWVGGADNNDKTRMDLSRWKMYDQYLLLFRENRILAELWFFADDSNFGGLSNEHKQRLARYAMARTSAFSHTLFVIALEWQEGWSGASVNSLGNFIQSHNPWGRMLSVHSRQRRPWEFPGESWATFIASQAGNGASPDFVNSYAIDFFAKENIPHLSEEFGHLNGDSDFNLRAKLWANFTGGAAGSGTGSDLRSFLRFLAQSQAPFQRMQPANPLVTDGGITRFALAEAGHHYVVYSSSGSFDLNVSGENLVGRWFNPRNPDASLEPPFAVSSGNQTFTPPSEANQDWVLWISDGSNLNSTNTHPSQGEVMVSIQVTPGSAGSNELFLPSIRKRR